MVSLQTKNKKNTKCLILIIKTNNTNQLKKKK